MTNFSLHTHERPLGIALKSPVDFLLLAPRVLLYVFNTLLVWQERATERHHLASLSDKRLRDIGLSRADIGSEIAKPFWRA